MSESLPATTETRPVGRPSLYLPEYCDVIVEMGAKGECTYALIGAALGIAKQTVKQWSDTHSEFSDALGRARTLHEAFWTRKVSKIAEEQGNKMAQQWYQFYFKNIAPDDWQDRREVQHSGRIEHTVTPAREAFIKYVEGLAKPDAIEAEFTEIEE